MSPVLDASDHRHAVCCELIFSVARSSGSARLRVHGTSMLPALWPGDVITILRCNFSELRPGQIVVYFRNGNLTAHRLHCITGDHLITRGDTLPNFDPPIKAAEVAGIVESVVRDGRTLPPKRSRKQDLFSLFLRRSDLCRRLTLRLARRTQPR